MQPAREHKATTLDCMAAIILHRFNNLFDNSSGVFSQKAGIFDDKKLLQAKEAGPIPVA